MPAADAAAAPAHVHHVHAGPENTPGRAVIFVVSTPYVDWATGHEEPVNGKQNALRPSFPRLRGSATVKFRKPYIVPIS